MTDNNKISIQIGGETYSFVNAPKNILGEGSFGIVFKADDSKENVVAIKVVAGGIESNSLTPAEVTAPIESDDYLRYIRRVEKIVGYEHENLTKVYGFTEGKFDDHRVLYVALEYVEGKSLHKKLCTPGDEENYNKLDPTTALDIIKNVAKGLGALHVKQLAHRDVKPENILITEDGTVKLCDYGAVYDYSVYALTLNLADITEYGIALGSPLYISPEEAEAIDLFREETLETSPDERSDIYSLGSVLYHIITGKHITAEGQLPKKTGRVDYNIVLSHSQGCLKINEGSGSDHGMPEEIFQLIKKMCALDPENRHQNVEELIEAIEAIEQSMVQKPEPRDVQKEQAGRSKSAKTVGRA